VSGVIRIVLNGEAREIPGGSSVAALRAELKLDNAPCAAEVNRVLVPVREQATTTLREGDIVELVTLVGGG